MPSEGDNLWPPKATTIKRWILCTRLQKPAGRAFEYRTTQYSCGVGAGVDGNPVRRAHRSGERRMSVDHDFPVRLRRGKKFIADPEQILLRLSVKRDPGSDTSVNKGIVAEGELELERSKEREVVGGDRVQKCIARGRSLLLGIVERRTNAIAEQRVGCAETPPHAIGLRILDEIEQ